MVSKPEDVGGMVSLRAFDASGNTVFDEWLSYEDYYGEAQPLIDDAMFRATLEVRHVNGKVFNLDGVVDQEFDNYYSADGSYVRGRAEHLDGTVHED